RQVSFRLLRVVVGINRNPFAALSFWIDRIEIDGYLPCKVLLDCLLRETTVRTGESAFFHELEVDLVCVVSVWQAAPLLAWHLSRSSPSRERFKLWVLRAVVAM